MVGLNPPPPSGYATGKNDATCHTTPHRTASGVISDYGAATDNKAGTQAVDWWPVKFGTRRRGWAKHLPTGHAHFAVANVRARPLKSLQSVLITNQSSYCLQWLQGSICLLVYNRLREFHLGQAF